MVVNCDICGVCLPSDSSMLQHLQGQRHRKNVELKKTRELQLQSSIFVRGFALDTTSEALQKYFSKYGNIIRFYKDTAQKYFAIIEYESVSSAQEVLKAKGHYLQGRKLVVKEREEKTPSRSHNYSVKMKKKKKNTGQNKETMETKNEDISELLHTSMDINEQMKRLKEHLQLTSDDCKQRAELCKILEDILIPYFPASKLYAFGSSVNGFGVHGCDLDLFLDFNDDKVEGDLTQYPRIQLPYVRDIKSLKKSYGPLFNEDLHQMSLYDKVKVVSRILCDRQSGCSEVLCIPSTRCPVVRFCHKPTGLKCDLSVNNRLALRNTELLALYSRLDERVKLLVFTVRYWGKLRKIAGNQNAGPRLTNYSLTLLVIYYLQNTTPPVLPTVMTLAQLSDIKTVINGWDCTFVNDNNKVPDTENKQSSAELLKGFFEFFSKLEFSEGVLICSTGSVIKLSDFTQQMKTSNLTANFKFGPINIQDPFVSEHNLTLNINEKIKDRIMQQFRIASLMTSDWFKTKPSAEKYGLLGLLSEKLPSEFEESSSEQSDKTQIEDKFLFSIPFKMSVLSDMALKNLQVEGDYRQQWCFHVCQFIIKLLSEILLIKTEIVSKNLNLADISPNSESLHLKVQKNNQSVGCELGGNKDIEDLDLEVSEKSVAKIVIDTSRCKRLSTESQNDNEPKRFRTSEDYMESCDNRSQNNVPTHDDPNDKSPICTEPELGANSKEIKSVDPESNITNTSKNNVEITANENDLINLPETVFDCTCMCATFNGRKLIRKQLLIEGQPENLDFEKEISNRIFSQTDCEKLDLSFKCILQPEISYKETKINVLVQPKNAKKQFSCFYQFMKTFVTKMVDKYLFSD